MHSYVNIAHGCENAVNAGGGGVRGTEAEIL